MGFNSGFKGLTDSSPTANLLPCSMMQHLHVMECDTVSHLSYELKKREIEKS